MQAAKDKRTFEEFMKFVKYLLHISNVAGKRYQMPSLAPNNPMPSEIAFGIEVLEADFPDGLDPAAGWQMLSLEVGTVQKNCS